MTSRTDRHNSYRSRRWATAILVICLLSCDRSSESLRTYDLVRILPAGNLFTEGLLIDIGTEPARDLISGFSWNETAGDGTTFAWSIGPTSTAVLTLCQPQQSQLRLRGLPWPGLKDLDPSFQTVDVEVNGNQLGRIQMSGELEELSLETSRDALRPGANTVALTYGSVREPPETDGDQRALGVAWDEIQLVDPNAPAADPAKANRVPYTDLLRDRLIIPPRSGIEYRLELRHRSTLQLDRLAGDGPLVVSTLSPGEPFPVVAQLEPGRGLSLDLPSGENPSALLTLCNPTDGDLTLKNPRIELQATEVP